MESYLICIDLPWEKKHGKITLTVSPHKTFTHFKCEACKKWRHKYLQIARFSSKNWKFRFFLCSISQFLFFVNGYLWCWISSFSKQESWSQYQRLRFSARRTHLILTVPHCHSTIQTPDSAIHGNPTGLLSQFSAEWTRQRVRLVWINPDAWLGPCRFLSF